MKIQIEIPDEKIVDALVGAFEGGSNYWYFLPDLSMAPKIEGKYLSERITITALSDDVAIPVYDNDEFVEEGGDSFLGYISKDSIFKGVGLYLENGYGLEGMDACISDILLQYIVMVEVVYG